MTPSLTSDALIRFVLMFIPAMFGIVCHEVAHGWAAYRQGDPTAKVLGRLTLNPVKHLDVSGTAVFVLTALLTPFAIGWAKPVPVQARYFRNPRQGMMTVSVAGPLANFGVALLCAAVYKLAPVLLPPSAAAWVMLSAKFGIFINCTLAWFNLLPVPPLDGSHILAGLLPEPLARSYESLGRYGMLIVIALVASGVFWTVLRPLIASSVDLIGGLFNIPLLL